MKNWMVSDIRWANESDLKFPFWEKWNKANPLPRNFWQRIWEYPYVASKIPKSGKSLDVGGTYPFVLFKNFPNAISVDCRNLNKLNHPFHFQKWPKQKLIICDAATISVQDDSFDYAFSISSIEEMPYMFKVLNEMIRIAKFRVVITMDVSDVLGIPIKKLRELEEFLKCRIPNLPGDSLISNADILTKYGQGKTVEYKYIRTLGFTIDACDKPKSVAILIPHWESFQFLKLCLTSIQKNKNKNLNEKVYVLDDDSKDGSYEKAKKLFENDKSIRFYRFKRPDREYTANVGLLLDYGLKLVNEQYVVMIDADVFPLTPDWLAFPIWLIEKYNCSSVGLDTGLSSSYLAKASVSKVWWQPEEGYFQSGGIYDNEWFTCTNNLYRVMTTAMAKVVSESIGFCKFAESFTYKRNIINKITNKLRQYGNKLNIIKDHRFPYLPEGCDNGVAANHFIDINHFGPKFNIPLTSYMGLTPNDGTFGQNISGLIFHFALSTRTLSRKRREIENAGKIYTFWVKKLNKIRDINDDIFKEMISASSYFKQSWYNSSVGASCYKKEYLYIINLLKQYRKES